MWHTLALALGGRSVAEWKRTMTQAEFLSWVAYYKAYPFDDLHRYHRPAALNAATSAGGKDMNSTMHGFLDWLAPDPALADYSSADLRTLAAFGIKPGG